MIAIGGEWGPLSEIAIAKKNNGIPVVPPVELERRRAPHGQGLDDLPRAATAEGSGGEGGTIAGFEEADEVISDAGLSGDARRLLQESVSRLRIVSAG